MCNEEFIMSFMNSKCNFMNVISLDLYLMKILKISWLHVVHQVVLQLFELEIG